MSVLGLLHREKLIADLYPLGVASEGDEEIKSAIMVSCVCSCMYQGLLINVDGRLHTCSRFSGGTLLFMPSLRWMYFSEC